MKEASIIQVKDYFGMSTSEFMIEWKKFTSEEKQSLKEEVGKYLEDKKNVE